MLGCLSHYIAYIIFKEFNHVAIGFYRYTCINTNFRNYLLDLCPHKLLFTQLAQYLGEVVIGNSSIFQSGLESINESRLSSNLCQEQSQLNSVVCFHLLYQKLCQPDKVRFSMLCQVQSQLNSVVCFHLLYQKLCQPDKVRFSMLCQVQSQLNSVVCFHLLYQKLCQLDKVRFSILCQVQSQLNRVVCFHLLYKKLCQPDKVRFFHLIPGTESIKQCWLRNTTSRYLDDILNINNVSFDYIVNQIYPSELQLNKANTSDTEATF